MVGGFDFSLAVDRFRSLRDELHVMVHGGVYMVPNSDERVTYHGVNYTKEVRKVLQDSVDVKLSYVALRDMERVLTEVQDIRLSIMLVNVELKAVLERPELPRNPQLSSYYRTLKEIQDKIQGYFDICQKQYDYTSEVLFGVSQVNVSINRRFFNGEDMMFNYKDDGK